MIGSDRLRAILGPSAPRHFVPLPKTLARFVERMSSSVGRTTKNKQGPMAPDVFFGTPTMIRTWDPQIRNLVLYPTELPGLGDEHDSSRVALASIQRVDSPLK